MPLSRWFALLLCTGILITPLHASAESAWYEIELVIFARNAEQAGASEDWPRYPGLPDRSLAITIPSEGTPASAAKQVMPVPQASYNLTSKAQSLARTAGRLEPLIHVAWRQEVHSRERAPWIALDSSSAADLAGMPPTLEGVVRLSLSRFLHVDLDLLLRRPELESYPTGGAYEGSGYATLRSYRMQDHRRMRSGELHYIDHPLLGVLIQAIPYEPPQPEPEAPAASEPTTAPVTPSSEPTPLPASAAATP